jgi:hypothetical protein
LLLDALLARLTADAAALYTGATAFVGIAIRAYIDRDIADDVLSVAKIAGIVGITNVVDAPKIARSAIRARAACRGLVTASTSGTRKDHQNAD